MTTGEGDASLSVRMIGGSGRTGMGAWPEGASEGRTALVRPRAVEARFARSVAFLMTKPAFARAPFGHIARMLAGQANRGHCAFLQRDGRTVGFIGWAFVTEALGESWLRDGRDVSDAEARSGDCVLVNAWAAEDGAASRAILDALPALFAGRRRLYARRFYGDGRVRPMRLDIARRAGAGGAAAPGV